MYMRACRGVFSFSFLRLSKDIVEILSDLPLQTSFTRLGISLSTRLRVLPHIVFGKSWSPLTDGFGRYELYHKA